MTEPNLLPPRRELSAATAARIRTRVLAGATGPARAPSRWLPLVAAAAVIALVAGAVAVIGHRPGTTPVVPATASAPATSTPATIRPKDIPSVGDVVGRCGVGPTYRYTTRYQGDGAVSWLFVAEMSTTVCTWKAGSTGILANFVNDWFGDGMAPAQDGRVHVTEDLMKPGVETGSTLAPEYAELEPDRRTVLGPVPAEVTRWSSTGRTASRSPRWGRTGSSTTSTSGGRTG